jgi:hypothetical protein
LGPLFAQVPGGVLAALFESLRRHRGRPRVGHRLTGCSTVAVKRGSAVLPHLTFYLQNSGFWRADERTRTAFLLRLRVIIQALQGRAQACKYRISKRLSLLRFAVCCTVLRSQWCQSGVSSPGIRRRRFLRARCAVRDGDGLSATGCVYAQQLPQLALQWKCISSLAWR